MYLIILLFEICVVVCGVMGVSCEMLLENSVLYGKLDGENYL